MYIVLFEEDLLQLHSMFTDTFRSIAVFLNGLSLSTDLSPLTPQYSLVIAAVRVLGAWLAEESLALMEEVCQLLPFMIHLCEAHLQHWKEQTAKSVENESEAERDQVQDQLLDNPLKFLLAGLSHLSAEERSRAILMKAHLPQLLQRFMEAILKEEQAPPRCVHMSCDGLREGYVL